MLLEDARTAHTRLKRMELASNSIEEAVALNTKAKELSAVADKVQALSRRNAALRAYGVPLTPVPDTVKVRQTITLISKRFTEVPKSTTLVDGKRWATLTTELIEFVTAAEALQKQDWKNYFGSQLFAGLPPEQRKQTILQTLPENRLAMDRYTRLYQRFNQYRNTVPTGTDALKEVHESSDGLEAISFVENDDVPAAVKAFFNATSSGSGAGLEFLTTEVVDWLRVNNMLTNYVVRAR
jgi:hypothetical protein